MRISFRRRKQQVDCAPYIRRIVNATMPDPPRASEYRSDRRYNRTMPVFLTTSRKKPNMDEVMFGLTKDLSDRGMGIVVDQVIDERMVEQDVIVGLWPVATGVEEPFLFRCGVQGFCSIGAGFFQVGLELHELLNISEPKIVLNYTPVATQLLPETAMK